MEQIIHPLKLTFDYLKANYLGYFPIYGVPSNAIQSTNGTFTLDRTVEDDTLAYVEERAADYLSFLEDLQKYAFKPSIAQLPEK
ncbi:hypothetical protein SYJ56_03615 [Algoriphagus sp. D3-2-R+10]|uniref:hypothetical protein n=1 Tax=Algoriphagus aurantiacus TaxID=3103948 RepID=UPI002B3FD0AE|nr:hypothetical protein [Algoriphagus sp. D3-2-R+10]MEB2774377.1 hypothetical protein [Algoriphagus sp. D3-2-R+10]